MNVTGGIQRKTTEVNRSIRVANQKLGTDRPMTPARRPMKSAPVSRRVADSTPSGMATSVAICDCKQGKLQRYRQRLAEGLADW